MSFTVLRRLEWIQKREGAMVPDSVRHKSKKNIRRHKEHTSLFSKLPDVMVVEILSRLPPKPFFRCRSVCKTWLSLSSDAARLNKHLQPTMRGFFYNQMYGLDFVNLSCGINKVEVDGTMSALSCHNNLKILDCCNGLLLVEASNIKSLFAYDVHVYNPTTRTLLTLWSHKLYDKKLFYQTFSLAFDPQVFHQFHVIRFTGRFNPCRFNFIDIFSFEKGKCKHHKKLVSDVRINYHSKGTFVNGRVHRLTTQDEILSVDPKNCSYQVIRPPNLENHAVIEIDQSQGVLHCISVCRKKRLFIWVLESYTRHEWTLKYQLSLDKIYPVSMRKFYRFCIDRIRYVGHFAYHSEKDVLFMPVRKYDFVSLDLGTGKGDKLHSLGNNREWCCWVYTPCYLV